MGNRLTRLTPRGRNRRLGCLGHPRAPLASERDTNDATPCLAKPLRPVQEQATGRRRTAPPLPQESSAPRPIPIRSGPTPKPTAPPTSPRSAARIACLHTPPTRTPTDANADTSGTSGTATPAISKEPATPSPHQHPPCIGQVRARHTAGSLTALLNGDSALQSRLDVTRFPHGFQFSSCPIGAGTRRKSGRKFTGNLGSSYREAGRSPRGAQEWSQSEPEAQGTDEDRDTNPPAGTLIGSGQPVTTYVQSHPA